MNSLKLMVLALVLSACGGTQEMGAGSKKYEANKGPGCETEYDLYVNVDGDDLLCGVRGDHCLSFDDDFNYYIDHVKQVAGSCEDLSLDAIFEAYYGY